MEPKPIPNKNSDKLWGTYYPYKTKYNKIYQFQFQKRQYFNFLQLAERNKLVTKVWVPGLIIYMLPTLTNLAKLSNDSSSSIVNRLVL